MNSIAVVEWLKFMRDKLFIDHEDILSEPEKEALMYAIFILEQQNRKKCNIKRG